MNKLCYRIVFNKRRGLCMAVQENASSHGKGRGQSGPASSGAPSGGSGGVAPRWRTLALAMLGAFGACGAGLNLATAQIVADPNAAGRQQATVLNTANGVLQVNVQTPSAAGVSRNVYSRFDVPASGAVLNNSRTQVQTQLGGWIDGNPWMAKGTARVILNEVNSNTPSQLRGYMEVAGVRAELVIANPAGIVVDGAGFINVSRATLTTGAPMVSGADGGLAGYTVQRGLISVEGQGLDGRQTDYTALIARALQLNAGVWAQRLEVVTGANAVTLPAADAADGGPALAPIAGVGEAPRYGIDAALLGGMYANKITLIGTEAGVGVRNAGSIGAAAGELVVTTDGRLENTGSIAASKALLLKAQGGLGNGGSVYGEAAVSISGGAAITNSGTVYASAGLALQTPAGLVNSGTISGATGLQLAAASLGNSGMISSLASASVTAQGDIDNSRGVIQAQSLELTSVSGGLNNRSGKIVQSGVAALTITADTLRNHGGGQVGAAPVVAGGGTGTDEPAAGGEAGAAGGTGGKPGVDAGVIADTGTGTGTGAGTGSATGAGQAAGSGAVPAAIADGYLRVAGAIDNDAGQIMSGGDIGLAVRALDNLGGQLNLSSLAIDGGAFSNRSGAISVLHDVRLRAGAFDNNGGKLLIGGNFDGVSQAFDNGGGMLSTGRDLLLDSGAITNVGGKIVAAGRGDINAAGAVDNNNGYIQAATGMALRATGKLDNQAGTLEAIGGAAALAVQAADIDNSKGRIVNAGSGASSITSATNVLNAGVIGANGALSIAASTMQNATGATVQSGAGLDLAIRQQLDNAGAISGGGALTFAQDAAMLNNTGRIAAGADIGIAILHANNDGGQIGTAAGSGADVALSASEISNRGGKLVADRDLRLAALKAGLDNTGGLIHAERDAAITVAQTLLNSAGVVETVGANSKLSIDSDAIQNLTGNIVNSGNGDTRLRGRDKIVNSGIIAGNGQLGMEAATLVNSGSVTSGARMRLTVDALLDNTSLISSAGKLDISAGSGEVNNSGQIYAGGDMTLVGRGITNAGTIASTPASGGSVSIEGATLDNDDGRIMASGDASVKLSGAVSNRLGVIQAGGDLSVAAGGALDNTNGVIEAVGALGNLRLLAGDIDNSNGRIVNVGDATTVVASDGGIFNSGSIAGNGMLTVAARTLTNTSVANVSSGGDLHLALSDLLQNDGVVQAGDKLTFDQTTRYVNNTGNIVSTGAMLVNADQLNNDTGQIATATGSNADLTIVSASLSNRNGGILSDGAADVAVGGKIDNRAGVIQSKRDQTVSAGGLLDNRAGAIETLGAASALTLQAGAIDNTGGRIVNAGTGGAVIGSASYIQNNSLIASNGSLAVNALDLHNASGGTISSGVNLTVGVRDTLNNYGVISSIGQLSSSLKTGTLTNAAQIVAGSTLQLAAGVLNNDGGQIATLKQSHADVTVTADSASNRAGLIQADRNAIFAINGALNNAQGMIQAGQNLQVSASGAINNTGGTMEAVAADSTLTVHGASLDNSAGRIVNVGAGLSHVGAEGALLNGGLVAGNGTVDVTAHTLTNTAGATIAAGGDLTLGVSQELANQGAINSIGALDFTQTTAAVRNAGRITAGGKATLSAGVFDNDGGQLATVRDGGGDIVLSSQSLSNRGGVILADHDARLTVVGGADNSAGAIQARQDMQLAVGGALNNNTGVIETINADSGLQLNTGSIDNTAGRIVNVGANATTVTAQGAIVSSGVIAGNGTLDVNAAVLRNLNGGNVTSGRAMTLDVTQQLDNAGAINSADTLTFGQTTATVDNSGQIVSAGLAKILAGDLNNDGGVIATLQNSGAGVAITGGSMSNHGGRVQASGDAVLDFTGALDNAQGAIQAGRDMLLTAGGSISNNAGVIEAISAGSALSVAAGSLNNGTGRIVNVGADATTVQAQTAIVSAGTIAGNGTLTLTAQSLQNNVGGMMLSGQQMALSLSQRLENHGAMSSGGTLDFLRTTAQVSNNGAITSAGKATILAGNLNNDGGQIATLSNSNADIRIDSLSMSNRGGRVLANGDADVRVTGALDNAQGTVQAGRDMLLDVGGALGNVGGVIEAAAAASTMTVQGGAIDNTGGRIVNVGSGDTRVISQSSLVSSGMIAGNGNLLLSALTARNDAGGTVASGGDLELAVRQQLRNAGTVSSAGSLNFTQTGAGFANSGQIIAGGAAVFNAASFNNDGGQIATAGASGAAITVDSGSISNQGGKILASGDASLTSGAELNNNGGTVQAGGDLKLDAHGALSNNAGAIEASSTASTLAMSAASIDSTAGRIVNIGSGDTTLDSDGGIVNSGIIAGNGALKLTALTLTNNSGGAIGAGADLALAVTRQLNNHAAISSKGALTFDQSAAGLINDGQIVAGGKAIIVAKTVVNDNGQIATAKGGAGDLALTTGSLSNVKGQILADGKATLKVDGALNNVQGTIQSVGDLQIDATGALTNDAGAIEAAGAAAKLGLTAQSIDNGAGRIANIGGGDASVTSQGAVNNNGVIAGNGNLLIKSATLRNGANGNIASGKDMVLQVTRQLDNLGKINSAGTLTFNQAAAILNNSGAIVSAGNALITAKQINNNGGQMGTGVGSDGDLALTTDQLSNEAGHISTGRDLVVVTHAMQGNGELQGGRDLALTMDGDYTQNNGTQQFHSNRDLSLTVTGNITNNATFEAVRNLTLSGNTVVNNAGAVIQGQGVAVKAAGDLTNAGEINGETSLDISSGGTINNSNAIVGGDLTLTAQNLNNTGAGTLLGATNSMRLGVAGTVNNTSGATIYSAGSIVIAGSLSGGASGVVNNVSSTIEASGDLRLNASAVNNIRENVSLVKVQTVDETKLMSLPSWYHHGRNNNSYDPNSSNYQPHEVYFVSPDDILENQMFYGPDGVQYGRAVIRTHANDSAFFAAASAAYSSYGSRSRIIATEGTRVLYYTSSSQNQTSPDQGGEERMAYYGIPDSIKWSNAGPTFSSQYGTCVSTCTRFVTQPEYNDPTTTIVRDTVRALAPQEGKLEVSRLAHHVAVEDQIAPGSGVQAQILSGGNMHLTVGQALTNKYGNIMATGRLDIDGSAAISNEGATLYRSHTFDGTWKTDEGTDTAYTMPSQTEVIGTAAGTISGGKGVSITGRSFTNVDVTAGTAGNIRDSVTVLATGNNTATGVSQASGSGLGGGSATGRVGGSGIGNNASGAGAVGGSGGANVALNGQAGSSGTLNETANGSLAAGSGAGNNAQTVLDTSGSGLVNGARDGGQVGGSGHANTAKLNGAAKGSGAAGSALGDLSSARGASQTQGASQVGGNADAVKVAPNGLSTVNPNANGKYLFETRSQFANHGNWISSDYLLSALSMDPATTQKRLGDGFYEQRMVRDQLNQLTGRAPTDGLSDDSRYKALLTSGVSFAEQFNLRPGIALTADQVGRLTSDIVWMETQTVSLPDGSVEQVLVPKVYLAHAGKDAVKAGGALVTGAGVRIDTTDSIVNSGGLIDGGNGRTVLIAGQDIVNMGGAVKGGDVALTAGRDVINQSLSVKQEYASVNTSGSYTTLSNQASITATGALDMSAGRDVTDTGGTIVAASAAIVAGRDIAFNALQTGSAYVADVNGHTQNDSSVTNNVGRIGTSGDLSLNAKQDLKLTGTQINLGATGNGTLLAGRDISIAAVVDEIKTHQENDPSSKQYDRVIHENQTVVGATVAAGGNLAIKAGAGALAIAGSNISGGGSVSLAASGDVSITQVQENHLSDVASHRESKSTFKKSSDTTADYSSVSAVVGSSVSGGAVTVKSGNDIVIGGSQLTAENALTLNAGRDLLVSSAEQAGSESHSAEHMKSGFSFSFKDAIGYTKSQDKKTASTDTITQVGSVLSGGSVTATSGRDTTISGSTVVADRDISIDAGRDLSIVSTENSVDGASASSSKKSGSIGSGFQPAVGTVKTANDGTADSVTQVSSQIASLNGDVTLKAGGKYTQTSSEVTTPAGNIAIVAKDVLINTAMNVNNSTDHMTYSKTAIGGTISSPVLDAAKSVGGMVKAAQGTSDSRMQALAALNVAATVAGMPTSIAAVKDAGLRVSISLGNSKSENTVVTTSNTVAGSTINAGGNVSITATGAGKDSNLTAIGSDITAGGNVALSADNDVSLLAAENTASQHSTNKSSGASIGVGFGIGGTSNGFTIDLAVSKARGKADGDDIGYTNTHVKAGNNVTVVSGGDTTLKGGVIAADSVVADVGGDLNIESLQDSSKFDSKQTSAGLNASLCIPAFCYGASTVGGSFSKSKVNGDFLSVLEQSGIKAGDGGFQVTVGGNTDLKGGLLSSSQVAIDQGNNVLVTGSLTASDLQNKDEYSASGFSVAGSVSGKLGGDKNTPPSELSDAEKKAAADGGKPTASAGIGSASGSQSSTTLSGISGGVVVITDQTRQSATGQDAGAVLAALDQTVTTESAAANGSGLTKGWDGQQLQKEVDAQVAITKEFSKQAPKAIADYAQSQVKALKESGASPEEIAKWGEGGVYRVALHAVSGALTGGLGGALGSTAVAGSAKYLDKLQSMTMDALVQQGLSPGAAKMFADGLAEATSLAIGTGVGGAGGGAAALGTDTNNRQLHPQEAGFIKSKADAYAKLKGITPEQAEQELTRGALYANDADWQKAYATYMPEEVERLKTAAFYLQDQSMASGLTFTTPDGKQQAAFTSTSAQFNNSQYLATQAFSDAKTRNLYSTQAAISLQEMGLAGGAKFGMNTAQGFASGVPKGVMDSLKSYAALGPETYTKLVAAVNVMMADPSGTMSKLATSLQGQAQDAAISIYIDWLQKDSAALGESAGKIYGGVMVDMALSAIGAKAIGLAADSAGQLSKALATKVKSATETLDIGSPPKIDLVRSDLAGSVSTGLVDGAGGGTVVPKIIPYEPTGSYVHQGDAPVCGPACAAMTITDKTGTSVNLTEAINKFENGIRPTGVNTLELSKVLSEAGVKNSVDTVMLPSDLNKVLQSGETAIVNVKGHFIIIDGKKVVDGVSYYLTRDPYMGPRGVLATALDNAMSTGVNAIKIGK